MSKHLWASKNLPLWYALDVFEGKMIAALGSGWAMKDVCIDILEFVDERGEKYPMSIVYKREKISAGTLCGVLGDAVRGGAYGISFSLDVHIMDA